MHTLKSLANILLPQYCPLCKEPIHRADHSICQKCSHKINNGNNLQIIIGRKLKYILCCRPYDGLIKKCIHQFKYCRKKYIISLLENIMRTTINANQLYLNDIDHISSVPISRFRHLQRGYNQSEIIALMAKKYLPGKKYFKLLKKTVYTPRQIGLSRKSRLDNLDDSFSSCRNILIKNRSILLVDDVYTTGTTLETCANELLKGGARYVAGFTLARTL